LVKKLLATTLFVGTPLLAEGVVLGIGLGSTATTTKMSGEAEVDYYGQPISNSLSDEQDERAGTFELFLGYDLMQNFRVGLTLGSLKTVEFDEGEYDLGYYMISADYIHKTQSKINLFAGIALAEASMDFYYGNEQLGDIEFSDSSLFYGFRFGAGYDINERMEIGLKHQILTGELEGEDTLSRNYQGVGYKAHIKGSHENFSTTALCLNMKF
jgi:hypothetical protein